MWHVTQKQCCRALWAFLFNLMLNCSDLYLPCMKTYFECSFWSVGKYSPFLCTTLAQTIKTYAKLDNSRDSICCQGLNRKTVPHNLIASAIERKGPITPCYNWPRTKSISGHCCAWLFVCFKWNGYALFLSHHLCSEEYFILNFNLSRAQTN